jgi:hypothetical protein
VDFRRTAGSVAAVILLAFSSRLQAAKPVAPADLPAIVVRVDNLAGVLQDDLQFAEGRASEIFGRIGAAIRWIDQQQSISQHITPSFIVVVENAQGEGESLFVDALGLAHPGVRRAYVFYDRIAALSVGTPRTILSLLGDVIAHELGHLMLPPPGHSADGIMRPGLETKSWAVKTFTKPQAREVLSRIRALH